MDCIAKAGDFKDLEMVINSYDRIVLVVDGEGITEGLTHRVTEYLVKKDITKRILLISRHGKDHTCGRAEIRQISEEYEESLLSIYRMYDFSDRFFVLMYDARYGSVLNYVKNGKMTWDEALDAVLCGY